MFALFISVCVLANHGQLVLYNKFYVSSQVTPVTQLSKGRLVATVSSQVTPVTQLRKGGLVATVCSQVTPVTQLSKGRLVAVWPDRVSARTGVLRTGGGGGGGEGGWWRASVVCNIYVSVAARRIA